MGFTPEQIKGRIKSVAKQNNADARTLMRIYMMERFLERLAQSEYRDNFIIKGGILVTAMIGVAHRSTMDIDTSMKNLNLSAEDVEHLPWIEDFKSYQNLTSLNRRVLVELVESITVYDKEHIHIQYRFDQEIRNVLEYCSSVPAAETEESAV